MTQHLPSFSEKVDDYFRKQREAQEKREREEQREKAGTTQGAPAQAEREATEHPKAARLKRELETIQMVDGLAIDSRDKRQIKREMVKLKAEFSYNRCASQGRRKRRFSSIGKRLRRR